MRWKDRRFYDHNGIAAAAVDCPAAMLGERSCRRYVQGGSTAHPQQLVKKLFSDPRANPAAQRGNEA